MKSSGVLSSASQRADRPRSDHFPNGSASAEQRWRPGICPRLRVTATSQDMGGRVTRPSGQRQKRWRMKQSKTLEGKGSATGTRTSGRPDRAASGVDQRQSTTLPGVARLSVAFFCIPPILKCRRRRINPNTWAFQ